MEALDFPVCLSQYFINKQNVRSFANIIKCNKSKKNSNEDFYNFLSKGEFMVSELPSEFIEILSTLRTRLWSKCKHDFKEYFPKKAGLYLQSVDKEFVLNSCWSAINEIIPRNFYGSNLNCKIFKHFVQSIIYSMKRQHVLLSKVFKKWDVSVKPWKDLPSPRSILHCVIIWIIKYIVAPMICLNFYITTCKLDANENKLYYFWKNEWQSFYDKQVAKMVFTKTIMKFEPYSLGKKSRKNHSLANRNKLKLLMKDIPKLHLTLKPNNDCRPIVCYKNNSLSIAEKYKIKDRLRFLRYLTGKPPKRIETLYQNMYIKWAKANKPKLYFIKTDLSNAFGSINREKLAKILTERFMTSLKKETCGNSKKRIAQQYKDIITELRKPILIRAGSTVYEWKEGLVQGYKYSPALSELYYSYLDEMYFSEHLKDDEDSIKLFTRVVDDYLYITDSLENALSFLKSLSNYRNVNYDKTVVNFAHDDIKFSEEINFLGYNYNTSTMQVSRASNIYAGQMCYKIAFTSGMSDLPKFIDTRIGQSGIQISSHIFNLQYNNEALVWRHIFNTFCLSANKFCTILAVLSDEKEMKDFLILYKKRVTVKLTIAILETVICNKPADFILMYCINHFRYLSWQALYLCAKQTPKCSGLVPLINDQLAKSNCIQGIWRPHASRIDTHGVRQRNAIKEICRRNDLRLIFKEFDKLPPGFECYHHRRLK